MAANNLEGELNLICHSVSLSHSWYTLRKSILNLSEEKPYSSATRIDFVPPRAWQAARLSRYSNVHSSAVAPQFTSNVPCSVFGHFLHGFRGYSSCPVFWFLLQSRSIDGCIVASDTRGPGNKRGPLLAYCKSCTLLHRTVLGPDGLGVS